MKLNMYLNCKKKINYKKNTMNFGVKSVILSEKNFIIIYHHSKIFER